jgi:hypothetical protein
MVCGDTWSMATDLDHFGATTLGVYFLFFIYFLFICAILGEF